MKRKDLIKAGILAVALTFVLQTGGNTTPIKAETMTLTTVALSAEEKNKIIDGILEQLNKSYVFPDTAKKIGDAMRDHQKNKDYDSLTDNQAFAEKLTADLQAVSHDKHLRVFYSERGFPKEPETSGPPTAEQLAEARKESARVNFGFEKVERLPGNIGYLDLRNFHDASIASETCAAAMNFLAETDSLILDLRKNGGGDPAMVQVVCSYLFDDAETHLNDIYWRPDDSTRQFWTLPSVSGKRYGKKRTVYVLTSNRTFSGAEECAYNLKNTKRATLIGETTGGGAHPGGTQRVSDHFGVFVPMGRAINPITKTNWEGTGVKPDIEKPAAEALKTAHLLALKAAIEAHKDNPDLVEALKKAITTVEASNE